MSRILIIDDRIDNLLSAQALINSLEPDYEVLTAQGGSEGIAMAKSELPDVILLDIHMPDIDGYEVCQQLRSDKHTRQTPIIFLTAVKTDSKDKIKGLEVGGDAYLTKPIDPSELLATVHAMLRIKAAEDANLNQFRQIVSSSNDMMALIDTEYRYRIVNEAYARAFNYSVEEIVDKTVHQVFGKGFFQKTIKAHADNCLRGESINFQRWVDFPAYGQCYMDVSFSPCYDENKQITGFVTNSRDISDRERAEEILHQSEQKFRSVTESAIDAIISVSKTGHIIAWNHGAEVMFQYGKSDILSKPITRIIPREIMAAHMTGVREFNLTHIPHLIGKIVELEGVRRDGVVIPVEMALSTWELESEQFFTAVIRDITERKRAEEALKIKQQERDKVSEELHKSEDNLREAQKLAHLGSWFWDVKSGYVEWSEEVYHIFGLDPKNFTPQIDSIMALSPWPEENKRDKELIDRAIESKSPGSYEQKFLRPDKSTGYYYSTFMGIYGETGDLISIRGTVLDITDRKKAEIILQSNLTALQQSESLAKLGYFERNWQTGDGYWSPGFYQLLGLDKNSEASKHHEFTEFIHNDDLKRVTKHIKQTIDEHTLMNIDFRLVQKNGSTIYIHGVAENYYDPNGKPLSTKGTLQDITQRTLAEKELNISEERFNLAMEATSDGIYDWNLTDNTIYYSPQWKHMLGYTNDELPNDFTIWEQLTDPRDVQRSWEMQQKLIKHEIDQFSLEFKMKHKSGYWVDILSRAKALFDDTGQAIRIIGTHFDLTNLKLLESQIRQNHQLLNVTGSIAKIGGWELNLATLDTRFTLETYNIYGLPPDVPPPRIEDGIKFYAPEAQPLVQKVVSEAIENHKPYDIEVPFIDATGKHIWVRTIGHVDIIEGKAVRLYGMIQDISDRKDVEESLKLSEQNYRQVVQDQNEFILRFLPDGTIKFANDSYCKTFQTSYEDVVGSNFFESLSKESLKRIHEKITGLSVDNQVVVDEHETVDKDGHKVWHNWSDRGLFNEDGELIEIQVVGRDITERKNGELALIESERRFHRAVSLSPIPIMIHDEDRKVLMLSAGWTELSGYTLENIPTIGDWTESAYGTRSEYADNFIEDLFKIQKTADDGEWRITTKDGSTRIWHFFTTPLGMFGSGKRILLSTAIDITEQIHMANEVQKSEEFNRSITEGAADAIVTINKAGLILSWNAAAEKIFGYTSREMMNSSLEKIVPEQYNAAHMAGLKRLAKGGATTLIGSSVEISAVHKNGSEFPIELSLSNWEVDQEKYYTGIIRDISDRKQAELEVAEALLHAEQANTVKDEFIANISHEIRTPLNSILGFSDLFKTRYIDVVKEKDKEIFGFITTSSNRLMRTVDSILNLAQLNAGTIYAKRRELNLIAICRAVTTELMPLASEKHLELSLIFTDNEFRIYADDYCIHQAILNLTENAIKYTFSGHVELRLIQSKKNIKLSLSDTGIGISEEYKTRMYQPYTQESEGFTKNYQGIGLGLALTKRYLDLNEVALELDSKKDVGSTFTLTFPKYEEQKNG